MRAAAEDLEDAPVAKRRAVHVQQDHQRKIRLVRAGHTLEEYLPVPDVRTLILSYANEFEGVAIMSREQHQADSDATRGVLTVWIGCLVSTSQHRVIVWDLDMRCAKLELVGHTAQIHAACVLLNGQLASGASDHTVRLWRPDGSCALKLLGHTGAVRSLVALDTGNVASMSDDDSVRVWDTTEATCVFRFKYPRGRSTIIGLPRGLLASASFYGSFVTVRDVVSKAEIQTLAARWTRCLALLPDGRLAAGSHSGDVWVYNISNRKCLTLSGHCEEVNALVVAGRLLASGSNDRTIRLCDTENGACLFTLQGHTRPVSALVFLPDGRLVSAAYDDVRVWNISTGQCELIVNPKCAIGKLVAWPDCKLAGLSEFLFSGNRVHVWA